MRKEQNMTYKQWEGELLKYLKDTPENEKRKACEYYREIFGDKFDAGIEENKILEEFGEPRICAERILSERIDFVTEDKKSSDHAPSEETQAQKKTFSISKWIGIFFLTTLVVIPLASVMLSVIASFGAVTVTAAALIIGGILGTLAAPLAFILGYTGWGVLSAAGTCLAFAGAGAILLPIFYVITKYCIVSTVKLTKYAIRRCKQ